MVLSRETLILTINPVGPTNASMNKLWQKLWQSVEGYTLFFAIYNRTSSPAQYLMSIAMQVNRTFEWHWFLHQTLNSSSFYNLVTGMSVVELRIEGRSFRRLWLWPSARHLYKWRSLQLEVTITWEVTSLLMT